MNPIGMTSFNKISFDKPSAEIPAIDVSSLDGVPLETDSPHPGVFGYSQGAVIASEAMRDLVDRGAPSNDFHSFVLVGNPDRPQGGILDRFGGSGFLPFLSSPNYSDSRDSVIGGPPTMSSQLASSYYLTAWSPPQTPGNDTVTISPEAQAAADGLDPVE